MMHHGGKRTVSSGRGETKMQEGQPRADRDLAGGAHNKSDNVRAQVINCAILVLSEHRPASSTKLGEKVTPAKGGRDSESL